jgi:chemotaxis protein MotA
MLAILGIAAVFMAVLGGFVLERGNLYLLFQPAELLIVAGAAAGILLVANPPSVLGKMGRGALSTFRAPRRTRQGFLRYMRLLYEVFIYAQRAGMVALEDDIDHPEKSRIFVNHPEFLGDRVTRDFVCDSLRMLVLGVTTAHELDQLMDLDIEVQRRGRHESVSALASIADSLPGLGIVAAVLGVVITMEAIGGSPETVGQKVAAALVGTFLGILLCYGVVGPIAARLENLNETEAQFFQVLRVAIAGFARGASPILAIEYARRSIPEELRPTFTEMEFTIKRDAKVPLVVRAATPEPVVAETQPA